MKGLLIFSKLNDLLHWQFDDELTRHFARVAQKQGLAAGEIKFGKKIVKLSKDALVHLFSPLVTTQRVMGLQMRNPYTYVKFPSGLGLAFEEVFNCVIICIGTVGEDELKRKASVVRQIMEFLFGPSFEMFRSKQSLVDTFHAMVDAWDDLRSYNLGFVLEAVERCQITPAANHVVVDVLRGALKCMGDYAEADSMKPTHAFLLTGTKLVALYSKRGEEDLWPSDFLLIVLLVRGLLVEEQHPRSKGFEDSVRDGRSISTVVMLHDPSTGERSLPRDVFAVPVYGGVSLVVVCESRKDELASGFVSCLRALDAVLKTKVAPPAFDLGSEVERILSLARKVGQASPELARFERNLSSQWETAKRNGFDAFSRDYKTACARTRQLSRGDSTSGGSAAAGQDNQASLRTRLVKFESLLAVIVSTLQEGFGLCCLDDFELKNGLDCLSEFVSNRACSQLGDFADFLRFKAGLNIDLVAFLEEFPTLVHFVYLDRRTNQVVCPGRADEELEGGDRPFWRKLKNAVSIVRAHVARGNHTIMWRDKTFVYSYHLWFENSSGESLLPKRESRNFAAHLPYPGVIGNNFYSVLARESFSSSRPSTSSSPPAAPTGRPPRVVVKELYCIFSTSTAAGLAAEDALLQAQRIADCLPNILSTLSTPVAFL